MPLGTVNISDYCGKEKIYIYIKEADMKKYYISLP